MGGGAWPFLVGGAICLVNSVNERDLSGIVGGGFFGAPFSRFAGRSVVKPREG